MSDDIRCFMVVDILSGDVFLEYKVEETDRREFSQEAQAKVTAMTKQQSVTEQTQMGMIFAKTDDELAYLIFVAPDYPERVAKQLVDKHALAVKLMASDGTFDSKAGTGQSGGAKKAYAAVCKTLAAEYEGGGDKVTQVIEQAKGEMEDYIRCFMVAKYPSCIVYLDYKTDNSDNSDNSEYNGWVERHLPHHSHHQNNTIFNTDTNLGKLFAKVFNGSVYIVFVGKTADYAGTQIRDILDKYTGEIGKISTIIMDKPDEARTENELICKTLSSEYTKLAKQIEAEMSQKASEKAAAEKEKVDTEKIEKRKFLKRVIDFFDYYDSKNPLK